MAKALAAKLKYLQRDNPANGYSHADAAVCCVVTHMC